MLVCKPMHFNCYLFKDWFFDVDANSAAVASVFQVERTLIERPTHIIVNRYLITDTSVVIVLFDDDVRTRHHSDVALQQHIVKSV